MPTPVHSPRPVFQEAQDIPDFARVGFQDKLQYLIDGVVRDWNGSSEEILSPIHLKTEEGSTPVRLGRCPLMGEPESLAALEAAEKAYGRGCGDWPTMSVADRIRHLESFIPRMQASRDDVVRLLMWEIGKTRLDSQKEFDRTLEYMRDTIGALKDLDSVQTPASQSRRDSWP